MCMDKNKVFSSNITDLYNCAYDSYLSKIDPVIIFHTFIFEIIKTFGANCGAIMKYDCTTMITDIITHASYKSSNLKTEEQPLDMPAWLCFSNYVRKNRVLNNTSIIMKCLINCTTLIENNCCMTDVLGIDTHDDNMSKIKKDTIMFIPCCVAGSSNGLIIFCFEKELSINESEVLMNIAKYVGDMTGVLMNNIKYRPLHCIDNDQIYTIDNKNINRKTNIDGSVTFQLIYDTLNTITDTVVITDADMRIVYKNDNFLNMIKTRYQIDHISEYLIDMIPQTISLMCSRDDNDNKYVSGFYRNKKMTIDDKINKLCDSTLDIVVNSTVSCNDVYHIFRFNDKKTLNGSLESIGRSKNLIAYLSHELRNPIQAISTGVYLVDRTIKSLVKRSENIEENEKCNNLTKSQTLAKNGIRIENNNSINPNNSHNLDNLNNSINMNEDKLNLKRSNSCPSEKELNKPSKLLRRSYIKTNDENNKTSTDAEFVDDDSEDLDFEGDLSIVCCSYDKNDYFSENNEYMLDNDNILDKSIYVRPADLLDSDTLINYMNDSSMSSGSDSDIYGPWRLNSSPSSFKNGIDGLDTMRCVIKRVSSACKNMNIIIDDILDLSKIDNDELIINFDEHSLREITEMIVEESKTEVNKKGLKFIYDFDETSPEIIYTDGTRLFQILSNLISNAIKYSNTGVIKFKVSYNSEANTIIFQVIDQGRGIRNEEISNLFKQFGRTSNSVTDINSTGLGLCVCQKIATLLGGSIDVTSAHRKGSTFTFTHPIKLGYSGTQTKVEQFSNREIKGDILIVDDDLNITSLFKLLLRCMNYDNGYDLNIETSNNGSKAIQLTDIKKYDLIFMDIDLDGEDGCTICNRILNDSNLNKSTPIVAVTANIRSVQQDRDSRFNMFSNVLLKPFNNKNINDTVVKYLCK
jgi:signal transduction histidine kinase